MLQTEHTRNAHTHTNTHRLLALEHGRVLLLPCLSGSQHLRESRRKQGAGSGCCDACSNNMPGFAPWISRDLPPLSLVLHHSLEGRGQLSCFRFALGCLESPCASSLGPPLGWENQEPTYACVGA